MKPLPWRTFPRVPLDRLLDIRWQEDEDGSRGAKTAALMVYVALVFSSSEQPDGQWKHMESSVTLDDLETLTGVSRPLLLAGIKTLVRQQLVRIGGSERKRVYEIAWDESLRFFKVPCRANMGDGAIKPFRVFTLRSRVELDALKLFLYLASVRSNELPYAMASYDKVKERLGLQFDQTRRAIAFLFVAGLLSNVNRKKDESHFYGPNEYYFQGHRDFFTGRSPTVAE